MTVAAAARAPAAADVAVLMSVHVKCDPAHFERALCSLREQTYAGISIYLFCDGPLDQAHEVAIEKHMRAGLDHVVRGVQPQGLPVGLNRLIDKALHDPGIRFLARMDADDICLPRRIEAQIEHLCTHGDIDVLGCWCIEFNREGEPSFHKRLPTGHEGLREFMLTRSAFVHPTVVFRRSVLEAGHRYDPRLAQAQDYELWSRLIRTGYRLGNLPEFLLWYRVADDFFARRSGWRRARNEVEMRWRYAREEGLVRPTYLVTLVALFLLRMAPPLVKRLAYARRSV